MIIRFSFGEITMLLQFSNTTLEIQYLTGQERTLTADKRHLESMLGQPANEENLTQREAALTEVNQHLAEAGLNESKPTQITGGYLGLSRLSGSLLDYIKQHQETLETINLSNNNLSSLPLDFTTLALPRLQTINLDGNRFSQETLAELSRQYQNLVSLNHQKGNKIEVKTLSRSRSYLPSGSRPGIDVEKHKSQAEADKVRSSVNICTLI